MRFSERVVVLALTVGASAAAVVAAVAQGSLAGFNYPGSELVWAAAFGIAGAIITRAQPSQAVGRLLLWSGLAGALGQLTAQFPAIGSSEMLFLSYGLLVVALARFPDGEWLSMAAKWAAWGMVSGFALQAVVWRVGPLLVDPTEVDIANPPWWLFAPLSVVAVLGTALMLIWLVGQIRLALRDPVRRRQVAVVILGGVLSFVGQVALRSFVEEGTLAAGIGNSLTGVVFPISIVVAVTRYRLYEIDRIISRTVTYGLVVVAMAAVYLTVLFGLGAVLDLGSDTEVALATLAAVAVSVPLVRRVREWVDRRFFRSRYDSALVVARVADDLRTTVDLDEVERRTEAVIDEVFSPEDVTVWLADRTAS